MQQTFANAWYVVIFFTFLSYVFGSFPSGLLFSKIFAKKDLRKYGSGNIGATNALRINGIIVGLLTFTFDFLKVIIVPICVMFIPFAIFQNILLYKSLFLVGVCIGAMAGHIFPIWLKLRGGKGVTCFLALNFVVNWQIGLMLAGIWIVCILLTRYVSLSSVIAVCMAPILYEGIYHQEIFFWLMASMALLVVYKHSDNIKNLIKGQERTINIFKNSK